MSQREISDSPSQTAYSPEYSTSPDPKRLATPEDFSQLGLTEDGKAIAQQTESMEPLAQTQLPSIQTKDYIPQVVPDEQIFIDAETPKTIRPTLDRKTQPLPTIEAKDEQSQNNLSELSEGNLRDLLTNNWGYLTSLIIKFVDNKSAPDIETTKAEATKAIDNSVAMLQELLTRPVEDEKQLQEKLDFLTFARERVTPSPSQVTLASSPTYHDAGSWMNARSAGGNAHVSQDDSSPKPERAKDTRPLSAKELGVEDPYGAFDEFLPGVIRIASIGGNPMTNNVDKYKISQEVSNDETATTAEKETTQLSLSRAVLQLNLKASKILVNAPTAEQKLLDDAFPATSAKNVLRWLVDHYDTFAGEQTTAPLVDVPNDANFIEYATVVNRALDDLHNVVYAKYATSPESMPDELQTLLTEVDKDGIMRSDVDLTRPNAPLLRLAAAVWNLKLIHAKEIAALEQTQEMALLASEPILNPVDSHITVPLAATEESTNPEVSPEKNGFTILTEAEAEIKQLESNIASLPEEETTSLFKRIATDLNITGNADEIRNRLDDAFEDVQLHPEWLESACIVGEFLSTHDLVQQTPGDGRPLETIKPVNLDPNGDAVYKYMIITNAIGWMFVDRMKQVVLKELVGDDGAWKKLAEDLHVAQKMTPAFDEKAITNLPTDALQNVIVGYLREMFVGTQDAKEKGNINLSFESADMIRAAQKAYAEVTKSKTRQPKTTIPLTPEQADTSEVDVPRIADALPEDTDWMRTHSAFGYLENPGTPQEHMEWVFVPRMAEDEHGQPAGEVTQEDRKKLWITFNNPEKRRRCVEDGTVQLN